MFLGDPQSLVLSLNLALAPTRIVLPIRAVLEAMGPFLRLHPVASRLRLVFLSKEQSEVRSNCPGLHELLAHLNPRPPPFCLVSTFQVSPIKLELSATALGLERSTATLALALLERELVVPRDTLGEKFVHAMRVRSLRALGTLVPLLCSLATVDRLQISLPEIESVQRVIRNPTKTNSHLHHKSLQTINTLASHFNCGMHFRRLIHSHVYSRSHTRMHTHGNTLTD